jgi:hypothetical protein
VSKMSTSFLAVSAAVLAGCAGIHESPDYERHTLSQLSQPLDGANYYWFDVTLTPEMAEESESAEALRMKWLGVWLQNKKACPNGHAVLERRPFGFLEHNPEQYDLRYKVQCN